MRFTKVPQSAYEPRERFLHEVLGHCSVARQQERETDAPGRVPHVQVPQPTSL